MIWVEGNDMRWISANGHIHTVYGTQIGYIGTSVTGKFWMDTADNKIRWIGSDGYMYTGKYNFQQFGSYFSNGPSPTVVSGQTP